MEKQYSPFLLREGNIADYTGGAIVVPSWTDLSTANSISHAINRKLEGLGVNPESFWPAGLPTGQKVPLYSAHFYDSSKLPDVTATILATCYVDKGEQDAPFYVKAAKTTANSLEVAHQHKVESIAFPAIMTGDQGGRLDEILPAMIDEFARHINHRDTPKITLYVFGLEAYDVARQIADVKLR